MQLYGATQGYRWTEGRHLFIMAAFDALRSDSWSAWPRDVQSLEVMRGLLFCLVDAVRLSLEESYENLGAYIELLWFTPLRTAHFVLEVTSSVDGVSAEAAAEVRGDFYTLLSLLHECSTRGLLRGNAARADLRKAFTYLQYSPGAQRPVSEKDGVSGAQEEDKDAPTPDNSSSINIVAVTRIASPITS